MAGFLADERLAALVEAGLLVLILWDGTSWCSGPQHIKCWQPVIYVRPAAEALPAATTPILCAKGPEEMNPTRNVRGHLAHTPDLLQASSATPCLGLLPRAMPGQLTSTGCLR